MIERLPRFFSPSSSTTPSISAMTAGSFGLRASKISVTRGRPPVMSCVPDASRGVLATQRAGGDDLAFVDFEVGPLGHVVEVENLAVLGIFDDELRMHVALVLHDHEAHLAAGILLAAHRLAFDQVLVADLAARLGENRNAVRVPFADDLAGLHHFVLGHAEHGAGRHFVLLDLAALLVDERDFAVAREHDLLAGVVGHDLQAGRLGDAALLGLDVALFDVVLADAADVERPHRELRAGLADRSGRR